MMRRREFIALLGSAASRGALKSFVSHALTRVKSLRDFILPIALSLAVILLTSFVLVETHSHLTALHVWRDPEDLALAYVLPTIFIAIFFGSTIAVMTSFVSGLAAAYFIYPPSGILINDPQHIAELGFILVLAVTASKAVAVIIGNKPLSRRSRFEIRPAYPLAYF